MGSSGAAKSPKKINLLDHHSIKHLLDESVTEVVKSRGYTEDVRLSNVRLLIGSIIIAIALLAQFYPKKFPENKDFLLTCIGLYPFLLKLFKKFVFFFVTKRIICWHFHGKFPLDLGKYVVFNALLQFISYTKEKNAFLFTHPPAGSYSTGLVVSSKLPRFSDIYTLTIASADPKSISANKPVVLTKSVTKWFTKDGLHVEGLFWKDVAKLIDDYNGDRKSK